MDGMSRGCCVTSGEADTRGTKGGNPGAWPHSPDPAQTNYGKKGGMNA